MCGIFGAVRTSGVFTAADQAQFVQATDRVSYRGPNDSGYLPLKVGHPGLPEDQFDVFLGSRRLSILDLSPSGHQPMGDGKGRWITYNGEIFNYVELRRELQEKFGRSFSTGTDTEVILAVYDAYGEEGFSKLNGMWAFAIVDVPRRRVVLSRDRFSIKPLYLLTVGDCLYFGSEIKQLLPFLPSTQMNQEVMLAFLQQGLLDHSEQTFFAGITRLPPRTTLTLSLETGARSTSEYWQFHPATPLAPADAVEQFRELLRDSVRIRLRSDVKVGVLLSGGLDSSAVAVLANQSAGELETYSIIADDPRYDEREFINILSATGIRNHQIVFRPSHVVEDMDKALYHSDEPFGGFSVFAQYKLLESIKNASDATVLLSGQGGDEVLLGYLKFFFFYVQGLVRQRHYLQALAQFAMGVLQRTVVKQFTLREAKRYLPHRNGKNGNGLLRVHAAAAPIWECADMRARQISDIEHYSVPALTHFEDRNSGAHSLEVRHPFLDHRFVDLVVNLPTEMKIHNGWTKHILRESLPEIPAAVRWRRDKQNFVVPEELWLKREFKPMIEDVFQNSKLAAMGILNAPAFLDHYRQYLRGRPISPGEIVRVLMAELWTRKFLH